MVTRLKFTPASFLFTPEPTPKPLPVLGNSCKRTGGQVQGRGDKHNGCRLQFRGSTGDAERNGHRGQWLHGHGVRLKIDSSKSGYLKSEVKQAPPSEVSETDRGGTISLSAHNLDLHMYAVALDQTGFARACAVGLYVSTTPTMLLGLSCLKI
ncbi:hypothetical protein V6N13_093837 [Hibiscus sabdariffa]